MSYVRTKQHRELMSKVVKEAFKKIDASSITKRGWQKIQNRLVSISDRYDLVTTKEILQKDEIWKNFCQKAGNRKIINFDPVLYLSILDLTKSLNNAGIHERSLTNRIKFIIEHECQIEKIKCKCGKIRFNRMCQKCMIRYPMVEWFRETYGDLWQIAWEKFLANRSRGYSKVSQKMFWKIYESLHDKSNCNFAELNKEFSILVSEKYNRILNRTTIFTDFRKDNKIIEFDGQLWHNEEYDKVRDQFTASIGFSTLRIKEQDFYSKSDEIIQKCLNFLEMKDTKS